MVVAKVKERNVAMAVMIPEDADQVGGGVGLGSLAFMNLEALVPH